jgi:hypothetical protein
MSPRGGEPVFDGVSNWDSVKTSVESTDNAGTLSAPIATSILPPTWSLVNSEC